MTVNKSLH